MEQAWNLFLQQNKKCALSGIDIQFAKKTGKDWYKNTTASLDRINSKLGYNLNNVQWVHKHVNFMKLQTPNDEFIKWCYLITQRNISST